MKKIIMIIISVCCTMISSAQTWDEWFNQKQTQVRYYLQQIAASKVYTGYLQKGYTIARNGLTVVSNIQNGDFDIHRDFFGSLKAVNPTIKRYAKIAGIIALQAAIIKKCSNNYHSIQVSSQFTEKEIIYIHSVLTNLLADTAGCLEELSRIMSNNEYQISDDERIKRIDRLYVNMQDDYSFLQQFGNESLMLAKQRGQEKKEIGISRALHGIR